jgi:autotransporter translocation and assembly factor TamB
MRNALLPLVVATASLLALPAAAQDEEEERDVGFIQGLIEENLSAPGLEVRLEGFEGALSSRATLEELTVADDAGVWLRAEEVVLDWNRSALLRGRLNVEEFTAARIRLERLPLPGEAEAEVPEAGASGFSLPNLPVAVIVERVFAERIELGETVLGEETALALEASVVLNDGSGGLEMQARRLDGAEGSYEIDLAFDGETEALRVDIDAREAEGGLIGTLAGLPGAPSLELIVQGEGPLDAFAADLALLSDEEERLRGRVALDAAAEGRRFDVDLGGDLTALVAPEYRSFFGTDIRLEAAGLQPSEGGVVLDTLALATQELQIAGAARIGADGWPELLDLDGTLASADGGPVLLPTAAEIEVGGAELSVTYDAAQGDGWRLLLDVEALDHPEVEATELRLEGSGTIARGQGEDGGTVAEAAGAVSLLAAGLDFLDPNLEEAVGERVEGRTDVAWSQGGAVRLSDLSLEGAGYRLAGDVDVLLGSEDEAAGLPLELDVALTAEALEQFSGLAGRELAGAAEAALAGTVDPLAGTFDLTLDAGTEGLALGQPQLDAVLAGEATVSAAVRRTLLGTELDRFSVETPELTASGEAAIYDAEALPEGDERAGRVALEARLEDAAVLYPEIEGFAPPEGPVELVVDVRQAEAGSLAWAGSVDAVGPAGATLAATGDLAGEAPDIRLSATVPDLAAYLPDAEGRLAVTGRARAEGGIGGTWTVDATADGPYGIRATVEGPVTGGAADVTFDVSVPDVAEAAAGLAGAELPALDGAARVAGQARQQDGAWVVDAELAAPLGVEAAVAGQVTGPGADATVEADIPDLAALIAAFTGEAVPQLAGPATLDARATREGEAWSVDGTLDAPLGIAATVSGTVTGESPDVDVTAAVPEIQPVLDAFAVELPGQVPGGARVEANALQRDGGWVIDAEAAGPWGLTVIADGPVSGLQPALAVRADLPEVQPVLDAFGVALAEPVPGGLRVEGLARRDRTGAWALDADAQGPFALRATVDGTVTGPDADVVFDAAVPELPAALEAFGAPLPNVEEGLSLEGRAFRSGNAWLLDTALSGPWGLTGEAEGAVAGAPLALDFSVALPDLADPLPQLEALPALQGALSLDGSLRQRGDALNLDATARGPSGITARAVGAVAPLGLGLTATVPELGDLVPAVEGRLDLEARLDQTPEGIAVAAEALGPFGARAVVETVLGAEPLTLDFALTAEDLSALAPAIQGGLDVTGTAVQEDGGFVVDLDGTGPFASTLDVTADLAGEAPEIAAEVRIPDASVIDPRLQGPIELVADTRIAGDGLAVDAQLSGAGGLSGSVTGTATGESPSLDFALSVADVGPFVGGAVSGPLQTQGTASQRDGNWFVDLEASGPAGSTLSAEGQVTGGVSGRFDLAVPDISPFVPQVPGPLRASGTARQAEGGVVLDARLTGPAGTTAQVSGTVGAASNLTVNGSVPLGLANPFIGPRALAGTARFDLALRGEPALENLSGTISTSGTSLFLPDLRTELQDISGSVRFGGGQATIDIAASPGTGGRLSVAGPVGLTAPFPAQLRIDIDAVLEDPRLYSTRARGQVAIDGPLTGGATITGRIVLADTEIQVPTTGFSGVGELPPVMVVRSPRPVRRTLERAGLGTREAAEEASGRGGRGGPAYGLDITVAAPRIFVRGRGLDAELGGTVEVTGTTANPITAGGIDLTRGRLDILDQRLTLDEGSIRFQGGTVPFILFRALTERDGLVVAVTVEGPANAPEVTFSSSPELPEEEVLAQLIFGRDLDSISPFQAVQLANSIATLAGRGSGGVLDGLRGQAGLDDLSLTQNDDGEVGVRAGKYLSDNLYSDVEIDADGDARVTLNLDLTPSVTVRGSTDAEGETRLGVFYQRDY